ncbi:MarR family transcriptional regulator [Leuconostoc mesenteroides]|uniref:MarR family transcriptional regulator n=2 Tax=Leuconostoc mesenteroides TaxID=1245 RepID=UPI00235EF8A1|nr:MarR family transcriptional regulator [Leuconostoc mesenteroides]
MEKGIKKGHPLPTKVVDEPSYKRPLHGFCYTHFNMKEEHLTNIENQILNTLPHGRSNAVTLIKVADDLHIGKHKVSEVVADLRRDGHLIGSVRKQKGGLYIIVTSNEFWETVNTIKKSIESQQRSLNALMQHAERFERE